MSSPSSSSSQPPSAQLGASRSLSRLPSAPPSQAKLMKLSLLSGPLYLWSHDLYRLGSDDSTLGTSKALARAAIGHNATVFTAIANDESKNTSSTDGKSVYDAASHCDANHSNHGAVAAIFRSPTASTRLAHADACCHVAAAAVGFCASIFSASLQGLIANFRDSQPQQRQLPVFLPS
ncbi:hypothetical protein E4U28_004396 [Claviceps purpurea]|nr:hypothetical protein E4U28_004396 [Claviceps purpurea]